MLKYPELTNEEITIKIIELEKEIEELEKVKKDYEELEKRNEPISILILVMSLLVFISMSVFIAVIVGIDNKEITISSMIISLGVVLIVADVANTLLVKRPLCNIENIEWTICEVHDKLSEYQKELKVRENLKEMGIIRFIN